MRLFIAIRFEDGTNLALLGVQERLRQAAGQGSFTRPENLHLTLAFLGETAPDRLGAVHQAMTRAPMQPLRLVFDHVGSFAQPGGVLWWAGLRRNPALHAVQRGLTAALEQEGFPLENRRFAPHLTLARHVVSDALVDRVALLPAPIEAPAPRISLMLSERINGVLTYSELLAR